MTQDQVVAKLGEPLSVRMLRQLHLPALPNGCEKKCGMNDLVVLDSGKVVDAVFRSIEPHVHRHEQLAADDLAAEAKQKPAPPTAPDAPRRPDAPLKLAPAPAKTPPDPKKPSPDLLR